MKSSMLIRAGISLGVTALGLSLAAWAPAENQEPPADDEATRTRAHDQYQEFLRNLGLEPGADQPIAKAAVAQPGDAAARKSARKQAADERRRLRSEWDEFMKDRGKAVERTRAMVAPARTVDLPLPQRVDLARKTENEFLEPEVIRSRNRVLRARMIVDYAEHDVRRPDNGVDQVRLRNYNGRLVGPTFRVRPGDTMRIVLENRLPPDSFDPPSLRLMPGLADVTGIPTTGEANLVIVADVQGVLHFRLFDDDGGPAVVNTDETKLTPQAAQIAALKTLLAGLWNLPQIPDAARDQVLSAVDSILGNPLMNTYHDLNTTNLHTHGLHVSPTGNSDNVLLQLNGGKGFEYEINIPEDHPSGTFWYHAHKHGSVSAQVSSGLTGMLIVEGGIDDLPEVAGMRERLFVLQQLSYTNLAGSPRQVIEPGNVAAVFGPTRWAGLNRLTSINGRMLPKITLNPGAIERWRFVLAGVRETVRLQLVPASGGTPIPLHEIAADGLPIGNRKVRTDPIALWPGYRSDVFVEAPARGEYLLIDAPSQPSGSINGLPEPLRFLARVVVAGPSVVMSFPDDEALRQLRLPSFSNEELATAGHTETIYALDRSVTPLRFTIDGKPYDPTSVRHLELNKVDVWTLRTGDVPHIFHIHVNPFEVLSDVATENGQPRETLTNKIWRDTYTVEGGHVVTFATRYRRYIGEFVQHCHILDHEDQGMMQQVSIDPPGGLMHGSHGATAAAGHAPSPTHVAAPSHGAAPTPSPHSP